MRKKSLIAVAAIAVLTLIGILVRQVAFAKEPAAYRFATITRGDMKATVSATGTLNAVTTVSVGTQVSGQVSDLYVDFNDHVKRHSRARSAAAAPEEASDDERHSNRAGGEDVRERHE